MTTALTPHTCRDCGVTIPDGRGWFVWPGFPADGSAPLGVVWIEDEPERTRRRATSRPPARSRCATPACLSAAPISVSSPTRTTRRSQATPRLPPPETGSFPNPRWPSSATQTAWLPTWSPSTHSGTSTSRSAASRTASQMRSSRPVRRSRLPSRSAAIPGVTRLVVTSTSIGWTRSGFRRDPTRRRPRSHRTRRSCHRASSGRTGRSP